MVCASTGNTSASAAAYAAAAGIACLVVLPAGKVARGKLAQALAAGARLIMVDGNFDEALAAVRRLGEEGVAAVVNSSTLTASPGSRPSPGRSSTSWRLPDAVALPVGNAGNITAAWSGFRATPTRAARRWPPAADAGFQAEGAAPIVRGAGEHPETAATAIRIGNPASWPGALAARDESGGLIEAIPDQRDPADAAAHPAHRGHLLRACLGYRGRRRGAAGREGRLHRSETVVCILTGHGLKDPDIVAGEEGRSARAADLGSIRGGHAPAV